MVMSDQQDPRSSPLYQRTADTISSVWPTRPIRPLPKTRLKEKLSPEQAESLRYPPASIESVPNWPDQATNGFITGQAKSHSPTRCDCGGYHQDSEDEDGIAYDHPTYRWSSPTPDGYGLGKIQLQQAAGPTLSNGEININVSVVDGYESFENTSNKKKRKIPISSSSGSDNSSLAADMRRMDISHDCTAVPQHQSPSGIGISGAGRGRSIKQAQRHDRNRAHGQMPITYTSSLSAKSRGGDFLGDGTKPSNTESGIISTAIAKASDQSPDPPIGKENSLLSHETEKWAAARSQFTFTCDSKTRNKPVWPLQENNIDKQQQHDRLEDDPDPWAKRRPASAVVRPEDALMTAEEYYATHEYMYEFPDANFDPWTGVPIPGRQPGPARYDGQTGLPLEHQPPMNIPNDPHIDHSSPRPRRRRPSREYAAAARRRRLAQEFDNYQHKPNKDSMWICDFCVYEDIWGKPPIALIRSYEVRDAQERKKAEERRRLLEKAKMKKNKGKGKNKKSNNQNNGHVTNSTTDNSNNMYNQSNLDPEHYSHEVNGEDYYDDDYDDGYDPISPNDPSYTSQHHTHHGCCPDHYHGHQHHTRQDHNHIVDGHDNPISSSIPGHVPPLRAPTTKA